MKINSREVIEKRVRNSSDAIATQKLFELLPPTNHDFWGAYSIAKNSESLVNDSLINEFDSSSTPYQGSKMKYMNSLSNFIILYSFFTIYFSSVPLSFSSFYFYFSVFAPGVATSLLSL